MTTWQPDSYQAAVLDAFRQKSDHVSLDAGPGTGKTRTLAGCLEQVDLDTTRVLVASFSREVRDAWARRLPDAEGLTVATLHGLGLAALRRAVGTTTLCPDKYSTLAREVLQSQGHGTSSSTQASCERLKALVEHVMVTLTPIHDQKALWSTALRGGLDVTDWEQIWPLVAIVIETGVQQALTTPHLVTFHDMLYIPYRQHLSPDVFDTCVLDETQDVTWAQSQFLHRSLAHGGRALLAGDARQCVYLFAGANPAAMSDLINGLGAHLFPLRVCYRCPRSHIALANSLYDVLEPRPHAPDGTISALELDDAITQMRPGDLVLCRTTGPLLALAYRLLSMGKPVRVLGQDIAGGLQATVSQASRYLDGDEAELSMALGEYSNTAQQTLDAAGDEARMASMLLWDRVHAIRVIWEQTNPGSLEDLRHQIQELCTTNHEDGITLATVHRAKGIEANRVFILRPDLIPHPQATTPEQKEQEHNLAFVSLTRSQRDLIAITPPHPVTTTTGTTLLERIEAHV